MSCRFLLAGFQLSLIGRFWVSPEANFFPLWDRAIAKAYNLELGRAGSNGERYWRFLCISKRQCLDVRRDSPNCHDPLKSIDEYNYCRYTKKWAL